MAQEFLQQIRHEMERAYRPRQEPQRAEQLDASEPPLMDLAGVRSALAALYASYATVGQMPPEPPTLRGRMGARLVKAVRRVLFWYTSQIVLFQYSAVRAFEEQSRVLEHADSRLREFGRREAEAREALELRIRQLESELGEERALSNRLRREWHDQQGAATASHNLDTFYAALENQFRGSREEIKERLTVYLPKLVEAGLGKPVMPILDAGCGRGEWLELLRELHLQASGIDLNRVSIAMCQERGLPAQEAEAVAYLRSLPAASLGAVTAFHLIEHLPLPQLLDLLDAAVRALKPGGVAIFETPNPNNILVSSRSFYLDPTHRHPIPPQLGQFLAESRGLRRVEIMELRPWPEAHRVDPRTGGEVAGRFNECFYGPQDYAIIGWKV